MGEPKEEHSVLCPLGPPHLQVGSLKQYCNPYYFRQLKLAQLGSNQQSTAHEAVALTYLAICQPKCTTYGKPSRVFRKLQPVNG